MDVLILLIYCFKHLIGDLTDISAKASDTDCAELLDQYK